MAAHRTLGLVERRLAPALTAMIALAPSGHAVARQCGSGWKRVEPQTGNPGYRTLFAAAYDSERDKIVLFGGRQAHDPYSAISDTWECDLATGAWAFRAYGGPPARFWATIVYDDQRRRCVLVNGYRDCANNPCDLQDAWAWDGAAWRLLGPAPQAVRQPAAAYHAGWAQVVLYGGVSHCAPPIPGFMSELFSRFDTDAWSTIPTAAPTPGPRWRASLAYSPALGAVFLMGGVRGQQGPCPTDNSVVMTDTWTFDGVSWARVDTGADVGPPSLGLLFFDPSQARMLRERDGGLEAWTGAAWAPLEGPGSLRATLFDSTRGRLVALVNENGTLSAWTRDLLPLPPSPIPANPMVTTPLGGTINLRIATGGAGPQAFQWRRDGTPLMDDGRVSGATTTSLRITPAECQDLGVYDAVVSNPTCPAATSPPWQVSLPALTISQQPASQTLWAGNVAEFRVVVNDPAGSVAYQWRRNGAALTPGGSVSGAQTPTLRISPVAFADRGVYDVLMTRVCGLQAVSAPATLNVLCFADTNADGLVNFADLNTVLTEYGQSGPSLPGDITGDGIVNVFDLNFMLPVFGTAC